MKKIEAIIRPEKLNAVLDALENVGYSGLMITEIKGHGKQKGIVQQWRGEQYKVKLLTKIKIEITAKDSEAVNIKDKIIEAAKTGEMGDGKIFIYKVDEAIKIRTGETGDSAL
jgi:nitrogen regulatory protein P-II 1